MKTLLINIFFAVAFCSCQQQTEEQPLTKEGFVLREQTITQNRKWAWFKPLENTPFIERSGVWHIKDRKRINDSTSTISFQNKSKDIKITTIGYNGLVFEHVMVIKNEENISKELIELITGGVPKNEKGEWIDKENNCIILYGR